MERTTVWCLILLLLGLLSMIHSGSSMSPNTSGAPPPPPPPRKHGTTLSPTTSCGSITTGSSQSQNTSGAPPPPPPLRKHGSTQSPTTSCGSSESTPTAIIAASTIPVVLILLLALIGTVVTVLVVVKTRRRNVAVQRHSELGGIPNERKFLHENNELQSQRVTKSRQDETSSGYETIPAMKTCHRPAHIQREGLYEELPGEGGGQYEEVDKIMGSKELKKEKATEKAECNRQEGNEPVYAMINKTFKWEDEETCQITERETEIDATSEDSYKQSVTLGNNQHPIQEHQVGRKGEETDSTNSAPELPPPYVSLEDIASQHPSDSSRAVSPTQDQASDYTTENLG